MGAMKKFLPILLLIFSMAAVACGGESKAEPGDAIGQGTEAFQRAASGADS